MRIGTRRRARNSLALARIAFAGLSGLDPGFANGAEDFRLLVAEEPHMGVVVRIRAYFPPDVGPPGAFRQAFDRVRAVARRFSSYSEDSELRNVEETAWRQPTPVSPELARLLGHALQLARQTDGAFDPTLGRVTRLLRAKGWGDEGPPQDAFLEARSLTGWTHVRLDASSLEVSIGRRGLQFDLGGIAKGFAADEALAALQRAGASRAVVAVAGDIAVGGPPPGEDGWRIGLNALGDRGHVERELTLRNQGVSTSGSRNRYYLVDGKRCSHIVSNAPTGCVGPAVAVSVVAPTALEADGLATALVAVGKQGSEEILGGRKEISVYWASGDAPKAADFSEATRP